jgi:hypothetical protein
MMEAGVLPPEYKNAAHHIVAGNAAKAEEARRILTKFGIDINDVANGAFLEAGYHSELHTNKYYEEVNRRLRGINSKEKTLEVLEQISEELIDGSFPK